MIHVLWVFNLAYRSRWLAWDQKSYIGSFCDSLKCIPSFNFQYRFAYCIRRLDQNLHKDEYTYHPDSTEAHPLMLLFRAALHIQSDKGNHLLQRIMWSADKAFGSQKVGCYAVWWRMENRISICHTTCTKAARNLFEVITQGLITPSPLLTLLAFITLISLIYVSVKITAFAYSSYLLVLMWYTSH